MFKRTLKLSDYIEETSILLLGPRQVGKTTLLKKEFSNETLFLDLLNPELYRDLIKSPMLLKEIVTASKNKIIIIDEIQKIPELLDVVQILIEDNKKTRFILTGSSARKLKRQKANLLGGRLYPIFLHPITSMEFWQKNPKNDIQALLERGGIPSILESKNYLRLLKSYVGIYLNEEIKSEGFARNLTDFSRFLEIAALTNSEQLDFASVARDVQLSPRTVSAYYHILQDTMIGYLVPPFKETRSRKTFSSPKFYFFDCGVVNHLCGRTIIPQGTPEHGKALEQFIFSELIAYKNYHEKEYDICYWRSLSKFEVDFVVRTKNKKYYAFEVKSKTHINKEDFKGISALEEDLNLNSKIIICREKYYRKTDNNTEIMPVEIFCSKLWDDKIFNTL